MKTISIIVPIYNVSAFLPKCLDTIASQLRDDWELILVNDGSTDDSLQICNAFAEERSNVRIVNKPNGGLSDARNAGTAIAQGEWIYYIDSDDWLAEDAIPKLLDFAMKNNCDVVQGGIYYAYSDHLLYDSRVSARAVLDNHEAMRQLIINDTVKNFAWGKLYKAELVRDIPFPVGKYFEDSYWQHLVMQRVVRYGIVSEPLYYYRQRESGISGEFSIRNLQLAEGYESRLAFIQQNYPDLTPMMAHTFWSCIRSLTACARRSADANIRTTYEKYYYESLQKYTSLFDICLKDDITWTKRKFPTYLKVASLMQRIYRRIFCRNHYKTIII